MSDKQAGLSVCMIISSFYPLIGGAERQAQRVAVKLIERGIDVCVLTRRYAGLKSYEEIDNIPVYRVPAYGSSVVASLVFMFSALIWLFFNGYKYRIVHCHQVLSPAMIGAFAKIFWGKNLVVKVPGTGKQGGIAQINLMPFSSFRKKLLRQVDRFIYLSDDVYKELTAFGFANVALKLPNGVDTDKLKPVSVEVKLALRETLGLPSSCRLVIFTGRLNPLKLLDILLRSWAEIVQSPDMPERHLLILGEGEESASLKALSEQLDIGEHLSFLGRRENVGEYLQASDIFVLPSESEGLSNSLLEAMACGLAVVATDVGGSGEVLQHRGSGLLVEPRNQSQLTDSLLILLKDRALARRLGREARKAVVAHYSLDCVVEQYVKLYTGLSSRN
jgi:glycosyltransferase involved in cell wall biosynthesis